MRSKNVEKDKNLLDPFWVLFADDESDDDFEPEPLRFSSSKQRCHHQPLKSRTKVSAVFDDFLLMPTKEGRQSAAPSKKKQQEGLQKQKKQQYWKRQKGGRLSFGRRSINKKNQVASLEHNSAGSFTPDFEQREISGGASRAVDQTRVKHDDGLEESHDVFQTAALPSLIEAFSANWDPWVGEGSSSSDTSASYLSDDSENYSTASYGTDGTGSFGTMEFQEVNQVLVRFQPAADTTGGVQAAKPASQPNLSFPPETLENTFATAPSSSPELTYDASPTSLPRKELRESAVDIEFDTIGDDKPTSSCLISNGRGGTPGSKKGRILQKLLCRSKAGVSTELAIAFPKLRMVADERDSSIKGAAVVSYSNTFRSNVPAHLQMSSTAFAAASGPQSLYEYDYDGGKHMDVAYNHFGPNPLSLLITRRHQSLPKPRLNAAIVQIEASTISMSDCSMRNGEWLGKDTPPLPITPGVEMVGRIFHFEKDASCASHLSVGDRVISLTRCGGNSRFISIGSEQLVKISEHVDPAEAACLPEAYLSAFQVLHFGQSAGLRYRNNALKGKSILILGTVVTTLGRAIVELAMAAGVAKILATSTPKHFPHLHSLGIIPVSIDPALWHDELNGVVDLVIISNANEKIVDRHFKVLKYDGHLIVINQRQGPGLPVMGQKRGLPSLMCKASKSKISMIDRTHDYSPFRQWEMDQERSKKDLSHLVKLLEKREIKPIVFDRIPLGKVAKAQLMVESQRHPSGFLVCEPWLRNKKRAVML